MRLLLRWRLWKCNPNPLNEVNEYPSAAWVWVYQSCDYPFTISTRDWWIWSVVSLKFSIQSLSAAFSHRSSSEFKARSPDRHVVGINEAHLQRRIHEIPFLGLQRPRRATKHKPGWLWMLRGVYIWSGWFVLWAASTIYELRLELLYRPPYFGEVHLLLCLLCIWDCYMVIALSMNCSCVRSWEERGALSWWWRQRLPFHCISSLSVDCALKTAKAWACCWRLRHFEDCMWRILKAIYERR